MAMITRLVVAPLKIFCVGSPLPTSSSLYSRRQCLLPPSSLLYSRFLSGNNEKHDNSSEADGSGIDRSKFTHEIEIRMPDMGEGQGKIIKWYKQEGDLLLRDDILCDIETPDFSFGMLTDDNCDALMGKILVEAGSESVKDNEVICTVFHPVEQKEEKLMEKTELKATEKTEPKE